jgi:hypothetical protein
MMIDTVAGQRVMQERQDVAVFAPRTSTQAIRRARWVVTTVTALSSTIRGPGCRNRRFGLYEPDERCYLGGKMQQVNYLAIAVAMVAAFVASTVWYAVFGKQYAEVSEAARAAAGAKPSPWKVFVELVRSLTVASVLAGFAANLDITTWTGALGLGLATWIGFPVVLLTGSIQWENVPYRLAAIHAGDWLVKLLLVSCIVSLWR